MDTRRLQLEATSPCCAPTMIIPIELRDLFIIAINPPIPPLHPPGSVIRLKV